VKRRNLTDFYPDLTRQQEVMLLLFNRGESSLAEIAAELRGNPKMQTVQTLLNGLMLKRLVIRRESARGYVYVPTVSKKDAFKSYQSRLVEAFAGNSRIHFFKSLLSLGFLSWRDVEDVRREEEDHQQERRRSE
jgi:predicted transcriptional regulator